MPIKKCPKCGHDNRVWQIDPQIMDYIKQHPYLISIKGDKIENGFVPSLSPERVSEELKKIMSLHGASNAINQMQKLGLLSYILQLPDEAQPWDMDQANKYHYQNVWDHTINVMQRIDNIAKNNNISEKNLMILNFVALFHDIGKLFPRGHQNSIDESGRNLMNFVGHQGVSTEQCIRILNRLRFSTDEINRISKLVNKHDDVINLKPNNIQDLEKRIANLIEFLGDDVYMLLDFGIADKSAHAEGYNRDDELLAIKEYLTPEKFSEIESRLKPLVNGQEIMDIFNSKPGKFVGEIIKELINMQIIQKIKNREEALCFVQFIAKSISLLGSYNINEILALSRLVPNFCLNDNEIKDFLMSHCNKLKSENKLIINGDEVIDYISKQVDQDISDGPWLKEALSFICQSQLDGTISSKEDALLAAFNIWKKNNTVEASLLMLAKEIKKRVKMPRSNKIMKNKYNYDDEAENTGPGGKGYRNQNAGETWYAPTVSKIPQMPPIIRYPSDGQGTAWAQQQNKPNGNFVKKQNKPIIVDEENPDFTYKFSIPLSWYNKNVIERHQNETPKKIDVFKNENTGEWLSKDYNGKRIRLGKDFTIALQFLRKVYNWKLGDYIDNIQQGRNSDLLGEQ